jgi:hypothetical protein
MGVYYQVGCEEAKEVIDPGQIDDLGCKIKAIASPDHPFGSVVIFAMARRWCGKTAEVIADYDEKFDVGFTNVTEEVLKEYNEYYQTNLRFTG